MENLPFTLFCHSCGMGDQTAIYYIGDGTYSMTCFRCLIEIVMQADESPKLSYNQVRIARDLNPVSKN